MLHDQKSQVDEAMRIALGLMEERAEPVSRMGRDRGELGGPVTADLYARRAQEYRKYAEILRQTVLRSLEPTDPEVDSRALAFQALGPE